MCADFEVGKVYSFIIALYKGDQCLNFGYISTTWEERYDAYHEVYNKFWTKHNRADGYGAGMQTETDADVQDALDFGFTEKGEWTK